MIVEHEPLRAPVTDCVRCSPMMNARSLVVRLAEKGVTLFVDNNDIRYRCPAGLITNEDKLDLVQSKVDIVAFLRAGKIGICGQQEFPETVDFLPSYSQELWKRAYGGEAEGQPVPLNISLAVRVGETNERAARCAIETVLSRHVSLLYSFNVDGEGMYVERKLPSTFRHVLINLENVTDEVAEAKLSAICDSSQNTPIPIEGGWLVRAIIVTLPRGQIAIVMTMNHIVVDGSSKEIIARELRSALLSPMLRPLDEVPVQFNAYTNKERALLDSREGRCLIRYWNDWCGDQPVFSSPSGGIGLSWRPGVRSRFRFVLANGTPAAVQKVARETMSSPFLIYLTGLCIGIGLWMGASRFPIRCLGDKRTVPNLASTVGLMYCADALEAHIPVGATFLEVLKLLQKEYARAVSMRLPTLQIFPPYLASVHDWDDSYANRIPATINFTNPTRNTAHCAPETTTEAEIKRPIVQRLGSQSWLRPISPIFLHLQDDGLETRGEVQFNCAIISEEEQARFIDIAMTSLTMLTAKLGSGLID